jgi:ANTAR domain/GAF domain
MEDFEQDAPRAAPAGIDRPAGAGAERVVRPALTAATTMFDLAGAALVVVEDGGELAWAVAVGELAGELESAASALWSGPCLQVVAEGTWVASPVLPAETRWPHLAKDPGLQEVRALLAVPVDLAGGPAGSLVLVRRASRAFAPSELDVAVAYGTVVAALLQAATEMATRDQLIGQLEHALHHRVVIEQAKGMLMEREGLGPAAAFDRLRKAARFARRRVSDVATDVVAGHPLPTPAAGD